MKILIITPWVRLGGSATVITNLAYGLQKRGHQVKIAALFKDLKDLPLEAKKLTYVTPAPWVSNIFSKSRLFFLMFGIWVLFFEAYKESGWADILNPHNFPSHWISVIISNLTGKKVVWTCNEPPPQPKLENINTANFIDVIGWTFASSYLDTMFVKLLNGKIVTPSAKTSGDVWNRYRKKASIVNFGIDFNFYNKTKGNIKIDGINFQKDFVAVCVGNLHPQKNQILAIKAVEAILPKISNIKLLLIGEGPSRKSLEKYIKSHSLQENIKILGKTDHNALCRIYKNSKVNLFTAIDHQSWGLTPLEAICTGTISIVTDVSGISEFIKLHNIGIIKKPTPQSFAEGILEIYKGGNKFKKNIIFGQKCIKKYLSWENYSLQYEKIFESSKII